MTLTVNGEFAEWVDALSGSAQAMATGLLAKTTSPVVGRAGAKQGADIKSRKTPFSPGAAGRDVGCVCAIAGTVGALSLQTCSRACNLG